MPTRKIAEPERGADEGGTGAVPRNCRDPEHDVPTHRVFEAGTWEHVCPSCGARIFFSVSSPTW